MSLLYVAHDAAVGGGAKNAAAIDTGLIEYVVSAFWGDPRAACLSSWRTYMELLLRPESQMDLEEVAPGAVNAFVPESGELQPVFVNLLLRLLTASAVRASSAVSTLDGTISFPVES